jgi:hypothetical protein
MFSVIARYSRKLEVLYLSSEDLTEAAVLEMIIGFPALRVLDLLDCTKISCAAIQLLIRQNSNLEKLSLSFCTQVTDLTVENMDKLTKLESINFQSCGLLTDAAIKPLGSDSIKVIEIQRCKFSSGAVLELVSKCPNLQNFSASFIQIEANHLQQLGVLCPSLCQLHLSGNLHISDKELTMFAKQLWDSLVSLELGACPLISDHGMISIFRNCAKLESLQLTGCTQLTDLCFKEANDKLARVV